MKRLLTLRTVTAIVLATLILLTVPAALAAELTRGIAWDMTKEDMLTIEGVPEGDTREGTDDGDFTYYSFIHFADTTYVTIMTYIFKSGQLVMYTENISAAMQGDGVSLTDVYLDVLMETMERHGGPALTDTQQPIDAFCAISEDSLTADDITVYSGWDLGDGSFLFLMALENEYDKCIYSAYVNEQVLFD